MSRHVIEKSDQAIAYGFDNAEGYFFQLMEIDPKTNEVEQFIIDESTLMTKMSNGKMLELMTKYNLPYSHIQRVAMDLPIEQ
jgi:hypothetical protein